MAGSASRLTGEYVDGFKQSGSLFANCPICLCEHFIWISSLFILNCSYFHKASNCGTGPVRAGSCSCLLFQGSEWLVHGGHYNQQVSKVQGVSEEHTALPSKSVASIQGESRLSDCRTGDGVCYNEADMLHFLI